MVKKHKTPISIPPSFQQQNLVQHLASLAHIPLSSDLEQALINTLPEVLNFVEQVKSLSLAEVEKTYRTTDEENVMREDVVTPSLTQSETLKNASTTSQGYFVVPRIIEND